MDYLAGNVQLVIAIFDLCKYMLLHSFEVRVKICSINISFVL